MSLIALLFSLGIILLAFEVMIPGGILGLAGGILLFTGCVLAFTTLGTAEGTLAIFITVAAAGTVFYVQFKILPNTKMGKRFFLDESVEGSSTALKKDAQDLIGKTATSVTVLSPSGYVKIDGKQYEAFSESGQIPKNTELQVTDANSFQLIVKSKA
ncbi:MAG: NfeD family protein [Akkermansiaceae bacterium]